MKNYQDEISRIKDFLKKDPRGLNIREISRGIKMNRNSVAKYLEILTSREEVDVRTHGTAKVYYLSQNVPISDMMKFSSKYIVVVNQYHRIVQANDAFTYFVKVPKHQLLQLTIPEIPTDISLDPFIDQKISRSLLGYEVSSELSVKNGSENRIFGITFTPARFQDQSSGVILTFEDITEKKEIENALKKSEEKYRTLIDNISDVVFSLDAKTRITYVSAQIASFGYTPEELISKKYDEVIFPEDREMVGRFFSTFLKSRKRTFSPVFRIINKSKKPIWVECNARIIQDEWGMITGILGVIRDITDRKRAEEVLQESQKKYRTLLDNMPDLVLVHRDGIILYVNPAMIDTMGIRPEEVVNRPILEKIAPEYHARVADAIRKRMETGLDEPYEIELLPKAGGRLTVIVRGAVIEFDGSPATLNVITDITDLRKMKAALRESEEKFRSFAENANDVIYTLTPGGIFTYISPKFTESLGYDTSDAIGTSMKPLIHPDDLPACREVVRQMHAEGENRTWIECRIRHKNGSWQWYSATTSSIRDDSGTIILLLGVCRDITGCNQADKAPRRARKKPEKRSYA